jgi:succinylglutamate desuccinylase
VGGVHGNEWAGIHAAERVLQKLRASANTFRGQFVGLTGNRAALRESKRYIDEDLNRMWTPERVEAAQAGASRASLPAELGEQQELLVALGEAFDGASAGVVLLDLHTTSGEGAPFVIFASTPRSRQLARRLPVPVLLGLERHIRGTLLHYVCGCGHVALAFEGGRTGDPRSVDHHEAAIWLGMSLVGNIDPGDWPEVDAHRERLVRATEHLPAILEVEYRHALAAEDDFRMEPGLCNFQKVRLGQQLASDRRGRIQATQNGYLLLPRYQRRGDDGFFIARPGRKCAR